MPPFFRFLKKKKKPEEQKAKPAPSGSCPVDIKQDVTAQAKPAYDTRHIIDKEPEKFVEFNQYSTLLGILRKTEEELLGYCLFYLKDFCGYPENKIVATKDYVYAEGTIPILLVAHLDTVHSSPVTTVYRHVKEKYLIAREGIGGDDRCGVYAIFWILANGFRPCVLFTTQEEHGGKGARVAEKELKVSPDIKFMVEIDRRGSDDCVFYQNDNKEFIKYIESFGFKEASGSFSDISVLGPAWNIASVNLSSGYYSAHTREEKIYMDQLFATIDKIVMMFTNLPEKPYIHVEKKYTWGRGKMISWEDYYGVSETGYGLGGGYVYSAPCKFVYGDPNALQDADATKKKDRTPPDKVASVLDCIEMLKNNGVVEKFFFKDESTSRPTYHNPQYIPTAEFANLIGVVTTRQGIFTIKWVKWRKEFKSAVIRGEICECVEFIDSAYQIHPYLADDLEILHDKRVKQETQAISADDLYSGVPETDLRTTLACVSKLKEIGFLSSMNARKGYMTVPAKFWMALRRTKSEDDIIYSSAGKILSDAGKNSAFGEWLTRNPAVHNCIKWIDSMPTKYENFWTVFDQFTIKPDVVKQPKQQQVTKARKALKLIASLPVVTNIWPSDLNRKSGEITKEPFFLLAGTEKTYWISDLLRSNSDVYNLITKEERASVRPGIDFLNTMYKEYPGVFEKLLSTSSTEGMKVQQAIDEEIGDEGGYEERLEYGAFQLDDNLQYLIDAFPELQFEADVDDLYFIDENNVTRPFHDLEYYINSIADVGYRDSLIDAYIFVIENW